MKHPFLVNISAIRGTTGARKDVECTGTLDELTTSGASVPTDAPVSLVGVVESVEGGVVLSGRVHADWTGDCRRCLGPASGSIDADVREIFENEPTEGETYPLSGEMLDLEPLARETVMLDLPVAALCREDCKGLCPNCGTNWNESTCDCDRDITDPRWAALDELKDE